MKCARLLLLPALLTAMAGATYAQGPMLDPAVGGACPPMALGPMYSDCPPEGGWVGGPSLQRTSRGYFSVDAFLAHRKDAAGRLIAANIATGQTLDTSDADFGHEVAPRVIVGYVTPFDVAVEFTGFYKDDFDAHVDMGMNPPGETIVINGFPGNPVPDTAAALGIGAAAGASADYARIELATQIHSYEFNLVETGRLFNFLAGLRYIEVAEYMTVSVADAPFSSTPRIGTYNHMYGGQAGLRMGHNWGLFGFEFTGKAGYFINDGQATVNRRTVLNASLGDQRTAGQNDAFAGELGIKFNYRPVPYLALQAGYQAFWITEVALAPDQINVVNPALTGTFLNAHGDIFYHGPSVGAEVRF